MSEHLNSGPEQLIIHITRMYSPIFEVLYKSYFRIHFEVLNNSIEFV